MHDQNHAYQTRGGNRRFSHAGAAHGAGTQEEDHARGGRAAIPVFHQGEGGRPDSVGGGIPAVCSTGEKERGIRSARLRRGGRQHQAGLARRAGLARHAGRARRGRAPASGRNEGARGEAGGQGFERPAHQRHAGGAAQGPRPQIGSLPASRLRCGEARTRRAALRRGAERSEEHEGQHRDPVGGAGDWADARLVRSGGGEDGRAQLRHGERAARRAGDAGGENSAERHAERSAGRLPVGTRQGEEGHLGRSRGHARGGKELPAGERGGVGQRRGPGDLPGSDGERRFRKAGRAGVRHRFAQDHGQPVPAQCRTGRPLSRSQEGTEGPVGPAGQHRQPGGRGGAAGAGQAQAGTGASFYGRALAVRQTMRTARTWRAS